MKFLNLLFLGKVFLIIGMLNLYADVSIEDLKTVYEKRLDEISTTYEANMKSTMLAYKKYLSDLAVSLQKQGDLDGLLAVKAESKKFESSENDSLSNVVSEVAFLQRAQIELKKRLDAIAEEKCSGIYNLWQQYDRVLDNRQKEMTKENDLAAALAVRDERQRVSDSDVVSRAKQFMLEAQKETLETTNSANAEVESSNVASFSTSVLEGFSRIINSSKAFKYTTYTGEMTQSFVAYSQKDAFVEWETAKVPSNFVPKEVKFMWAGESNTAQSNFNLTFNGKHKFDLKGKKRGEIWECSGEGMKLEFKGIKSFKGIFTLTVPSSYVTKGNRQRIRIESLDTSDKVQWFMLYDFQNLTNDQKK